MRTLSEVWLRAFVGITMHGNRGFLAANTSFGGASRRHASDFAGMDV